MNPLRQVGLENQLCHHPVLNFVEMLEKHVQIGRYLAEVVPSEDLIDELVLGEREKQKSLAESRAKG